MHQFLVAYDISNNRRRHQAMRLLRGISHDYQDSVFEIITETTALLPTLIQLIDFLDHEEDQFALVRFNWTQRIGGASSLRIAGKGNLLWVS